MKPLPSRPRRRTGKAMSVAEAGKRGGKATASKRTPEERTRAARKAVNSRWARQRLAQAVAAINGKDGS